MQDLYYRSRRGTALKVLLAVLLGGVIFTPKFEEAPKVEVAAAPPEVQVGELADGTFLPLPRRDTRQATRLAADAG